MKRILLTSLLWLVAAVALSGPLAAASWVVFDIDRDFPWPHTPLSGPGQIIYTLENGQLTLDPAGVHTVGGSSAYHWNLLFSGQWAVLGSIGPRNILAPDPYASFVQTNTGEGYISWAGGTPQGYTTSLILGGSFAGDGAATYQEQNVFPADTVTGTLVLHRMFLGGSGHEYELRSHTFEVAYATVPEPSGLLLLIIGLPGLRVLLSPARARHGRR